MVNKGLLKFKNEDRLVFYSFVFMLVADSLEFLASPSRFNINSSYICLVLKLISIVSLLKLQGNWKSEVPNSANWIFKAFIFCNLVAFLRGVVSAGNYWEWKFLILSNSFNLLIPYSIIIGIRFQYLLSIFRFVLKKVFVYSFYLVPFATFSEAFAGLYVKVTQAIGLFLMFSVYLRKKWVIVIFIVAFFSMLTGLSMRANAIRISVAVILVLVFYFRSFLSKPILRLVCLTFFSVPFVFLFLGLSGTFNVFKIMENDPELLSSSNSELGIDTRTLLYAEVFESMSKKNSLLIGEGATGRYESVAFSLYEDGGGRFGAEVGFLNTLLYEGLVGAILYFIVLVTACFYAINHSNNFLCKMLSVFLAARWVVFFIEDVTKYDLTFYFLWIIIGLCFSDKVRRYSDGDIRNYFLLVTKGRALKSGI